MNWKRIREVTGTIIAAVTFLSAAFTAAYFSTGFIFGQIGWRPDGWLASVITSLFGLFLAGFVFGTFINIARKRGWNPERGAFEPVVKAIQQIARGDYNVRLPNTYVGSEPWHDLVDEVNAMASQLGQMEQLRQEFISDVSHEIQSPLTSIYGFAQALQTRELSASERANYLEIIMSESTRLGRITENLLRLAALQSPQPKFEPTSYRLDKQLRDLILACEPQWTAKDIDLEVNLAAASINADADLLSQVWINLLNNAIKFTPQGGRICVELVQRDDEVAVTVADTGIGIAAEDQPRLFERFYKADKSRTSASGGSGLGLAIAKRIVEMHHGSIGVTSTPGAGASFTVQLPISSQVAIPGASK